MSLFAALHLQDPPGAIVVGDPPEPTDHRPLPVEIRGTGDALDELARDVATTLPTGCFAGGDQPKFLALTETGEHVLVKFTPPRGTPFGERWHDLLHAEALATTVLAEHGVPVAAGRVVETGERSYLLSPRFDRIGVSGRRHVVAVGAVHEAFVPGPFGSWSATCEALVQQGRLTALGAAQARALLEFARLTGNDDMHAGNLSLSVDIDGLGTGRFSLAPVYDMLPMRWRPNPLQGGAPDYAPFEPDPISASGAARAPARVFWQRLSEHHAVGPALRQTASEMVRRLS